MKKLFLCTCNKTLNKWIDLERIQKEIGSTFELVKVHDALCLEEGLAFLESEVKKDDAIVIGACTSQIIGVPLERRLKSEQVSFVPIREHVAWVHKDDKKSATNKALILLHDGAIHVDHMEPKTTVDLQIEKKVLVVGGGIAGLKVASDLVQLGVEVILLEPPEFNKDDYVELNHFMADNDTLKDSVKGLLASSKGVKKLNGSVTGLTGRAGLYVVSMKLDDGKETDLLVGSIVIATHTEQTPPSLAKSANYGKSNNTVLISELSSIVSNQTGKTILVAQDTTYHESDAEGSYLLREVANAAEKGNTVIVAHFNIYTKDEKLYRKARESGVIFVRGTLEKVDKKKDQLVCRLENTLESQVREFIVDYVVLQAERKPWSGTRKLANAFDIELDKTGFIKTRYSKMKPVQTSKRGIFIAGNAKTPMNLNDALASASNASLEVFKSIIAEGERKGWIPVIDEEQCDLCEACVNACPNDALRRDEDLIKHVPMNCEFCGICVSACPTRAIEFQSHKKDSWLARIEAIGANHKKLEGQKPFTLVYACSECANASIDQAGFTGKGYPTGNYVLQFPCAGMVSPIEILKGLVEGAEQVIVAHCPPGGCHHQTGDHLSELIVKFTQDMLTSIGQDPSRVKATYMIAALPNKMQEEVANRG